MHTHPDWGWGPYSVTMTSLATLLPHRYLLHSTPRPRPSVPWRRPRPSQQHRLDSSYPSSGPVSNSPPPRQRRAVEFTGGEQMDQVAGAEQRARIRGIIAEAGDVGDGWEECWKQGLSPWDVGGATPVVRDLVEQGALPDGRALVPGCGAGHDVLALATPSRRVVGLDVSPTGLAHARRMAAESGKGLLVEFALADFFQYSAEKPFQLALDYTFFCAIHPDLRPAWAAKMAELLAPGGELLTLIYPIGEYDGGPPYAVSVQAYEKVLHPHGFSLTSCVDNELAIPARKGREKVGRWVRPTAASKV